MREEEKKLNHRNAGRKKTTCLQGALENNIFKEGLLLSETF